MYNREDHLKTIEAKTHIENKFEWRKWVKDIPAINFPRDWDIHIIPPFSGAVARFIAKKNGNQISVYLDCYDELGIVGSPYWEFYPYRDDVYRCDMGNTDELIEMMAEQFDRMEQDDD